MVPVRPTPRADGHPAHRLAFYVALFSALALAGMLLPSSSWRGGSGSSSGRGDVGDGDAVVPPPNGGAMSPETVLKASKGLNKAAALGVNEGVKTEEELDGVDVDPLRITQGSVAYARSGNGGAALPYYRCGPLPSRDDEGLTELVLLHGAAFTREDWKTSGILDALCEINNEEDEGDLSIIALDLPVSADGGELGSAFDALVSGGILSGRPATFVTPSASGKAVVSLAEMASTGGGRDGDGRELLTKIVKAWIPVASPAVLKATDSTLTQYRVAGIPVLSIHGDKDEMGKRVTEKLKELTDANCVELDGGHPVYLDSPQEFVGEVMQFLDEMGL
jgi:pimeloyl-ACP methyl ester carboxylesterase